MGFSLVKSKDELPSSVQERAFVLLHPDDNILVCCREVKAGEMVTIDQEAHYVSTNVLVGHKIARRALSMGDKVYRYGAPIGTVTADVETAAHIHTHNLKSDYIPSHGRDAVHIESLKS